MLERVLPRFPRLAAPVIRRLAYSDYTQEVVEEAAKMADDPIVDIDFSAFHDDKEWQKPLGSFSIETENYERFIILRACFDVLVVYMPY